MTVFSPFFADLPASDGPENVVSGSFRDRIHKGQVSKPKKGRSPRREKQPTAVFVTRSLDSRRPGGFGTSDSRPPRSIWGGEAGFGVDQRTFRPPAHHRALWGGIPMACGASSQVLGAAATRARVPRDVPDTSATLGGGSRHCGEPFERPTPIPISPHFNGTPYRAPVCVRWRCLPPCARLIIPILSRPSLRAPY